MKAVILAGGYGTRLMEESVVRPKPMVEIGNKPILWHIMKIYSAYGINDFIICLGYKGNIIKEYFANYYLYQADITFDMTNNTSQTHQNYAEPWRVTLVETGLDTLTGGRLKRVAPYLENEKEFCLTYGDGVADIDISALIELHRKEGRLATLTAVTPPGRYGSVSLDGDSVTEFCEKPVGHGAWINGGFFVLSPKVLDYIEGDQSSWEGNTIEKLVGDGQLAAYRHEGFWHPMDTLRDKKLLERLWAEGRPPWKVW